MTIQGLDTNLPVTHSNPQIPEFPRIHEPLLNELWLTSASRALIPFLLGHKGRVFPGTEFPWSQLQRFHPEIATTFLGFFFFLPSSPPHTFPRWIKPTQEGLNPLASDSCCCYSRFSRAVREGFDGNQNPHKRSGKPGSLFPKKHASNPGFFSLGKWLS